MYSYFTCTVILDAAAIIVLCTISVFVQRFHFPSSMYALLFYVQVSASWVSRGGILRDSSSIAHFVPPSSDLFPSSEPVPLSSDLVSLSITLPLCIVTICLCPCSDHVPLSIDLIPLSSDPIPLSSDPIPLSIDPISLMFFLLLVDCSICYR